MFFGPCLQLMDEVPVRSTEDETATLSASSAVSVGDKMAADTGEMSVDNLEATTATTSNPPIAVYLYAGDQIVENVTTGYLYFQDSLGNTSHVTDAAGNLKESYTYSAFGIPTFYDAAGNPRITSYDAAGRAITASAFGIRHLFQGQLWTQETGLNDYRNRVELPTMGVFLQPDPIGFKGDAANVYRFCNNNAVNRTDPTGLIEFRGVFLGYAPGEGLEGPGRDLAQRLGASNVMDMLNKLMTESGGAGTASTTGVPSSEQRGVHVGWDITNKIRLVRNVTKRDGGLLIEHGEPAGAATRKDFSVTAEDAHNVTAHLSIDTQIATNSSTKLTRYQLVNKEYENVQTFLDWASKGEGGMLARTAFRFTNYGSAQQAADGVYRELARSLEKARWDAKVLRDGPTGTHVPHD
jgi:RHS repeat-associated protein